MSKKVIIIGAGFGGLLAARALKNADVELTIIDRANHHLFQPLIYQVATAVLPPSDVASPVREILRGQKNVHVIMSAVENIDVKARQVTACGYRYDYDYLIVASGLRNSYFGHDDWEQFAPGLKTLQDAVGIRERLLISLEKAECECTDAERCRMLTFVVVGGGPTGVELAGALADIKSSMLKGFKRARTAQVRIVLIEALDRILCGFTPDLSHKAKQALEDLDVEVKLNTRITDVNALGITTEDGFIETENVIWAAGTRGHDFVRSLGAESDRSGRILVDAFCNIADHPEVFVIGDTAAYADGNSLLPAVAQVAMQQGKYVAGLIKSGVEGADRKPFKYKDKGSMAVIGRNRAVLQSGRLRLWGYPAWLIWMVLHILVIVEFRNRFRVLAEWLWYYTTRRHGTRLITGRRFPGN